MRKQKDDYLVFAKFCIDNMDDRPHHFIQKAYKVDLIRNLFSKSALYNYFLYFKRYIKDGHKCKAMPQKLCDAVDLLRRKQDVKTTPVKPKTLTYEEIIKHIDNEYNNLQEKYNEQLEKIAKDIGILEQKRKDLDNFLMFKTQDLNDKRNKLIREYFERM